MSSPSCAKFSLNTTRLEDSKTFTLQGLTFQDV
jgi:hypothetical protein